MQRFLSSSRRNVSRGIFAARRLPGGNLRQSLRIKQAVNAPFARFSAGISRYFSSAVGAEKFSVLFGSQTGTAMGFAHELAKAGKTTAGAEMNVLDLGQYDPQRLFDGKPVVLVTACFGHGEPTDNARTFYNWLMHRDREAERDRFETVLYTIFGLGQSVHYPERYQQVSKEMDARLKQLGAVSILDRGEGDDGGDIEADFEAWSGKLWNTIKSGDFAKAKAVQEEKLKQLASKPPSPAASMQSTSSTATTESKASTTRNVPSVRNPWMAPITLTKELHTKLSPRSVKHIEIDTSGSQMEYSTGDYLGVFPHNNPEQVKLLADRLGLPLSSPIDVTKHDKLVVSHLGMKERVISLERLLVEACDILSIPRRSVLRLLANGAKSSQEKKQLEWLGSDSQLSRTDFLNFVVQGGQTILQLLQTFPSVSMTADELIDLLPPLQSRFYSISSSPALHPQSISITVARSLMKTPSGRMHEGVCSTYLTSANAGDRVAIFVKESMFRLPNPSVPIIMIGAGTGVAPFHAFIQERMHLAKQGEKIGPMVLYFGVDHPDKDFLYKDELMEHSGSGLDLQMAFAFQNPWRVFVQHRLIESEQGQKIWSLLQQGAHLYVCGDGKYMAPAVQEALTVVAMEHGKMDRTEASAYLRGLQANNHYQLDVFAAS